MLDMNHTHIFVNINRHLYIVVILYYFLFPGVAASSCSEMDPPDPDYILRGFDAPVTSLVFLPNSWEDRGRDGAAYLLAGTETGSLFVWNLKTRRAVHCMTSVHANSVLSLSVLNGGEVLSQGREGVVIRWKLLAMDNWLKMGYSFCLK